MEFGLKDRVALVTGGSRGMGKAIAVELAKEGVKVIICGRSPERLAEAKKEIYAESFTFIQFRKPVHTFLVKATNPNDIKSIFSCLVSDIGRLDILVNNVGGAEKFGDFFSLTDEDWEGAWKLNFMSMVYFCREAILFLKKSDQARIINISSLPAHQPGFFNPHYSAAKAAMLNLNKYLANTLAKDNILVNAICLSTLKGGGWDRNVRDRAVRDGISHEEAEKIIEEEECKKTPLGRIGMPEDVAKLAVFLSSSANNYITGSVIDIDGGIRRSVK